MGVKEEIAYGLRLENNEGKCPIETTWSR